MAMQPQPGMAMQPQPGMAMQPQPGMAMQPQPGMMPAPAHDFVQNAGMQQPVMGGMPGMMPGNR